MKTKSNLWPRAESCERRDTETKQTRNGLTWQPVIIRFCRHRNCHPALFTSSLDMLGHHSLTPLHNCFSDVTSQFTILLGCPTVSFQILWGGIQTFILEIHRRRHEVSRANGLLLLWGWNTRRCLKNPIGLGWDSSRPRSRVARG